MPLPADFKKHLHELRVEVSLKLQDEEARYKNQLVGKAIQTHNSAAMPIAYKDAELHRIKSRVSKIIEKYLEAVSIWGLEITPAFEKDMINEFWSLTAGPNSIQFPPAIKGSHTQAVQGSFSRERSQLTNRLVREGTNRLRELKMKMKQQAKNGAANVINLNFHAPVGKVYSNSVDQSVTMIQNQIDLDALAGELEKLRLHLAQSASTANDYAQLQLVAEAKDEAVKRNESKAREFLAKGGKALLDAATDFGAKVTAELIAKGIGLTALK